MVCLSLRSRGFFGRGLVICRVPPRVTQPKLLAPLTLYLPVCKINTILPSGHLDFVEREPLWLV